MTVNVARNQHIVPGRSLLRFGNESGIVQVGRPGQRGSFRTRVRNPVFCVKKVWDHKTEALDGKEIEDNFQAVVDKAIASGSHRLSDADSLHVTTFFALWIYRSEANEYDAPRVNPRLSPQVVDVKEKLELEWLGISFIDETGSFPAHVLRGWFVMGGVMNFLDEYRNLSWFMCRGSGYEFIIADNPAGHFFIPVSPDLCLIPEFSSPLLSPRQCRQANLMALASAKKFYCARDFSRCI
jgi:hypothetical protein